MERLEGISLSDKMALDASGADLSDVARRGATVFLDMIFRDGFYHADPHPGNLTILGSDDQEKMKRSPPKNGLLDYGMVDNIDDELREELENALLAAVNSDAKAIVGIVARLGKTPSDLDEPGFESDICDLLDDYSDQSLRDFTVSGCLRDVVGIIRDHRIFLPSKIAMLLKVLGMLEGTAHQLSPEFSLAELLRPTSYLRTEWVRAVPQDHHRAMRRANHKRIQILKSNDHAHKRDFIQLMSWTILDRGTALKQSRGRLRSERVPGYTICCLRKSCFTAESFSRDVSPARPPRTAGKCAIIFVNSAFITGSPLLLMLKLPCVLLFVVFSCVAIAAEHTIPLERVDSQALYIQKPLAVIEVAGSGSIRLIPSIPLGREAWVLEMECFCIGGIQEVTATPGLLFERRNARAIPAIGHSEAFVPYVARLGSSNDIWPERWKELRLDLKMKPDTSLQIRNVRLRG